MQSAQYLFSLRGIGEGAFCQEFLLDSPFFSAYEGAFDLFGGHVKAILEGIRTQDTFVTTLHVRGEVETLCDRCNTTLTLPIEGSFALQFALGDTTEEVSDDTFTISRNEMEMPLDDLLRQYVVLSLPMRKVHPLGACEASVEEFLSEEETPREDPRWAGLHKLSFDNNENE